jgi:hypothetical protein
VHQQKGALSRSDKDGIELREGVHGNYRARARERGFENQLPRVDAHADKPTVLCRGKERLL